MYRRPPATLPAAVWPNNPRHDAYRLRFELDQHFNAKIYTSGSAVKGRVTINAVHDVPFDVFEISLVGVSTTQNFLQHESGIIALPFMKLLMPIQQNNLPANKVFAAGQEYSFPFHFVVPFHLAIGACRHKCASPAVKEQHLRPPPTMGFWEGDDQSPQMTQIKYAITVLATRTFPVEFLPARVIAESRMIRVLPAFPEDAPLDITSLDDRYVLSRSKTIRKNFVASKLGRLTVTAAQPQAIMLSADGHAASGTSCRLSLTFDSACLDAPLPKINSVTGKLTSHTYFDISFMSHLPNLGGRRTFEHVAPPYEYTTSRRLFSLPIGDLSWREETADSLWEDFMFPPDQDPLEHIREADQPNRTDSPRRRVSAVTCPDMSSAAAGAKRCTSELNIQFTVPSGNKKVYLPTFHSCRISRTYTLDLCLSVGQSLSTLSLVVPIQIGVEPRHQTQQELQTLLDFASVRGQDQGRRNTYAGLPGFMLESSDNEPPGYF